MALRLHDGPLGPPWQHDLRGSVDRLVVGSEALAGNPLGDPTHRPLYVYRPPGVHPRQSGGQSTVSDVPVIFVLQAFLNQADRWFNRDTFEPTIFEVLDARFGSGEAPPAVVVFADAWTSLGGSQFINSPAVGNYGDYLCEELVPFIEQRYPVGRNSSSRGLAGHSSGGYGAAINAMVRPDLFGAFSSRAGDALFDVCFQPEFPVAAKLLRDNFGGSVDAFLAAFRARERFDYGRFGPILVLYAAAASFSPGPDGRPLLPFEPRTGRTIPEVFDRWLAWDPVRLAGAHVAGLRGMRHIHLEAGLSDEANLDLATQAFSDELSELGVAHSLEFFAGGHGGTGYRLPQAIIAMASALAAG